LSENSLLILVRIRGTVNVRHDVSYALRSLRLNHVNNAVLLRMSPSLKGQLQKVKDYIAWGEISRDILIKLLKKRGRLRGDRPLTEGFLKDIGYSSLEEFADALLNGSISLNKLDGVKPVFRLHPPKGGYKRTVKKGVKEGGVLGYWGPEINKLIDRMI